MSVTRRLRYILMHRRIRMPPSLTENVWVCTFQLIELGLLVSNRNYFAFLQAGLAFIRGRPLGLDIDHIGSPKQFRSGTPARGYRAKAVQSLSRRPLDLLNGNGHDRDAASANKERMLGVRKG